MSSCAQSIFIYVRGPVDRSCNLNIILKYIQINGDFISNGDKRIGKVSQTKFKMDSNLIKSDPLSERNSTSPLVFFKTYSKG